jgi:diguanylate cyclase (GGDEF)-like protein/PAS domain S-box-containing protein
MEAQERNAGADETDRFFDLSPDLLAVLTREGRFVKANPAWKKTLGFDAAELAGESAIDLIHPDDLARTLSLGESMVDHRRLSGFENRYRCKDGSYRWLHWSAVSEADTGLIYAVARDVTEDTRVRIALEKSEQRYRDLAEQSLDFIANESIEGKFTYVSPACRTIFGYEPEDMVGRDSSDFVHPDEREEIRRRHKELDGDRFTSVFRGIRKDGSFRLLDTICRLVRDSDGVPTGFLVICRDITDRAAAQETIRQREEALALAQAVAHLGTWDYDVRTGQNAWSDELYAIYGIEPGSIELQHDVVKRMTHPDDREELERALELARTEKRAYSVDIRINRPDGTFKWIQSMGQWEFAADGSPRRIFGTALDITERKTAELDRRKSAAGLATAQHLAHMGSWESDLLTGEVVASDEFYAIYGLDRGRDQVRRETLWAFDHPDDLPAIRRAVAESMKDRTQYQLDHRIVRRDGTTRWVHEQGEFTFDAYGRAIAAVGAVLDITDRKEAEDRLVFLAHHDALTSLPNRVMLGRRLEDSIEQSLGHGRNTAVLFLDIDRFKNVNDTLGHRLGDLLLKAVAARLIECMRPRDTIARTGGDEFVIVADDVASVADASAIAQKIVDSFVKPITIGEEELYVTASIGVSVCPQDGVEPDTLIRNADTAMYRAKDGGRNRYEIFSQEMHSAALTRLSIEKQLNRALQEREFELFYQPTIDLETGAIVAGEALIRWRSPERGMVQPAEFIAVAEETGLIVPIGAWVLHEGARQAKAWAEFGTPCLVSVNVSGRQLRDSGFIDEVRRTIEQTKVDPRLLGIEITESAALGDPEMARVVLGECGRLGMDVLLDDFGTHYSSLTYLKKLPIDVIKIDRSFVNGLPEDADDAAIVSSVIGLGENLGCRVIAEGVERPEQHAWLRARGCRFATGFWFARPMPAAEFALLLSDNVPGRKRQ